MQTDKVFVNGRIYVDVMQPSCGFLAVSGSNVAAAGNENAKEWIGRSTEVIDLQGMAITPSLIDSHVHYLDYALSLNRVNLGECRNHNDVKTVLKERASRVLKDEWVLGRGWNLEQFNGFPHRKLLDEIFPVNPVVLNSHDEHLRWLNSKALEIAGVRKDTRVAGGFVGIGPDGEPDGLLGENAVALVRPFIQQPDSASRKNALLTAQDRFHKMGLAGFHSMDANQAFADLLQLKGEGKLRLRVFHSIPIRQLEHAIEIGMQSKMGDDWFQFGLVKIFSDGALGSRTALMLDPYNESGGIGIETIEEAELAEKVRLALSNGIACAVHAIGDRANRQVLNAFEKNSQFLTIPRAQSRIEHAQLLHPDDISRFHKLGVIASMQPYHAVSDCKLAEQFWGDRAKYSYAWRSLLDSGATLIFGSDAPVEDPDPVATLRAAVYRENWKDRTQTISVKEALFAYTSAPAYSSGDNARRGTLMPGKFADFTIFSDDPIESRLNGIQVTGTVVGGEIVYRDFS